MTSARVAVVGCGYWGKNLVRNFAELGALAAVSDGNPETAKSIAEQNGSVARDYAEILADPAIEGVAFATPAPLHAAMARGAIAAGKHVFVEKPLALAPADARAMIADADAAGRRLMVGHLLQYHPIFARLRELVAQGAIGELQYVYSNRLSLGKFRTEENVLWSFAPHDVSMLASLTNADVVEVSAQGASFVTPGVADWATCQLRFANGVAGHITASWLHPFKEHRLVAVGAKGMLVFEDSEPAWDRKLALYRHSIDRSNAVPAPVKADPEYIVVDRGEPLKLECAEFLAAIAEERPPLTDGAEGLRVLEILDRAETALGHSLKGAA